MSRKKFLVFFLALSLLLVPLHAYAADTAYVSDSDVLARGKFYYSYLNQFWGNIVRENGNAVDVTLTGAVGFCDTDYTTQSDFDARVRQETVTGPTIYIEYTVTEQSGRTKTCYSYDLLPVGTHLSGSLAQINYSTAIKNFSGNSSGVTVLGNGFVKDSANYKIRLDLADYAANGYSVTKAQVDGARAAQAAAITESPTRYYAGLEKLLMSRGSNTEINEVIVCVKGIFTDDELASISYTDDSKIQYWMDYYTMNMKNQRLRVKKAYSVLGDLTVIGNASAYNKMALIANGRDASYTEIAPGMYRNADGWTVFRVNLNDYTAHGYVY